MKHNISALSRIIKQIIYVLDRKQKEASVVIFLCMILSSSLELLGVSAIYPFLQMMLTPAEIRGKWYVSWIYFFNPNVLERQVLLVLGIGIILIYLLKNAFMIVSTYAQTSFAAKFQRDLSV